MYLQAFLLVWVTTNLLKRIFFGTLRAAEIEVRLVPRLLLRDVDGESGKVPF